jgi:hypothetical protein
VYTKMHLFNQPVSKHKYRHPDLSWSGSSIYFPTQYI